MSNKLGNQSSIFEFFGDVIPESMKSVAKAISSPNSSKPTRPASKPASSYKQKKVEEVLVPLPTTVYYARERRMMTIDDFSEKEITFKVIKKIEVKPDIIVKKEGEEPAEIENETASITADGACNKVQCCAAEVKADTGVVKTFRAASINPITEGKPEVTDDDDLDIDIEDEEDDDEAVTGNENTAENPANDANTSESTGNSAVDEVVETDDIPKVTLETIRQKLAWDWPELSKERTKMDYDSKNNIVTPIVYSGAKGASVVGGR